MKASRSSPVPLYLQITDIIRQRIAQNIWPADSFIPSLEELAAEFQTSRVTVRHAVQLLSAEGVLQPRRGKGTLVAEKKASLTPINVVAPLQELSDNYSAARPELLHFESGRRPVIHQPDLKLAANYICMHRRHFIADTPCCLITLYLAEELYQQEPERFREQPVIPLLMEKFRSRIQRASQTLTLDKSDSETSHMLHIPQDAPVARVRRIFSDAAGVVVYYAEVVYRGDAVKVEMALTL